jgi:predicted small lipoprotein YifL
MGLKLRNWFADGMVFLLLGFSIAACGQEQ